jgi:glutaredoxin
MRYALAAALLAAAFTASAQQLYRWTDEKGRVHITDTPPPPSAKSVQKKQPKPSVVESAQTPYEVTRAMRDFPVTLYTSPSCKEPCSSARQALNQRAVPFKEVQVWDEETNALLKRVSGANEVPTLIVGASVHRGYEQGSYDALLDSAGYPKAGTLPPRAQAAPQPPEGYLPPEAREKPIAEPAKPEPPPAPAGPYSPKPPAEPPKKK